MPPSPSSAPEAPAEYRIVGPPPPAPRAGRSPRTLALVAVVAVVVAAGVLVGSYEAGVGPFHRASPPPSGPVPFSAASSAGAAAARGYGGGQWDLIGAGSVDVRTTESFTPASIALALSSVLPNCTVPWLTSASVIEVPAFSGDASLGVSPFWELAYRNASSGGGILLVTVLNGSASLTALLPQVGACATYTELATFVAPISSSAWDSPAALGAANGAGGSAFLAAHPDANVTLGVSGPLALFTLSYPSQWSVVYSLCALDGSGPATAPEFNATIDALTGAVRFAQSVSANCSAGPSLGFPGPTTYSLASSLTWSAAVPQSSSTGHWANATVLAAGQGINFADLEVSVVGPSGTVTPTASWSITVVSPSDQLLASYSATTGLCLTGPGDLIAPGDVLSVYSASTSLSGDALLVTGLGPFVGSERIAIP